MAIAMAIHKAIAMAITINPKEGNTLSHGMAPVMAMGIAMATP